MFSVNDTNNLFPYNRVLVGNLYIYITKLLYLLYLYFIVDWCQIWAYNYLELFEFCYIKEHKNTLQFNNRKVKAKGPQ